MEMQFAKEREMSLAPLAPRQGAGPRAQFARSPGASFEVAPSRWLRWLALTMFATTLAIGATGCKKSTPLPNPVESKDGIAYIPIDDTAFLIPENTWLKGYSRKATDGTVGSITLHATVPDVQPWSQARQEEMYWKAGPGKKLLIYIQGNEVGAYRDHFHEVPHSRMWQSKFIEEPSDQTAQGLRRFRRLWLRYNEKDAEKDTAQFGADFVEERRRDAGKPMMDMVYYEFIENGRVKYFIHCGDSSGPIWHTCHLSFPWERTLMIDIEFTRDDIGHIVAMADKVGAKLYELEAAGLAHRAAKSKPELTSHRQ